jgi:2-iminoacetate synthase ThiH
MGGNRMIAEIECNTARGTHLQRRTANAANARLIAAAPDLLMALRCAVADLEGIMPEFEPSGERTHPAWTTITEARQAIAKAEGGEG